MDMALFRVQTALGVGFSVALFVEQFGCSAVRLTARPTDHKTEPPAVQGQLIGSFSELKPDAQPGAKADMLMAGTHIPVNVSVNRSGSRFEIILSAHNETFETERYRIVSGAFSLQGAAGDTYLPALDLLRFPSHLGDNWNWVGTVSSGGIQRHATATVSSSSTNLYSGGVTTEAVQVEVNLSLYSQGEKTPAARKLVFDFVPGKGIVRREFGDASVRQPAWP
jgi:hypothetical protein